VESLRPLIEAAQRQLKKAQEKALLQTAHN
jgi:hypothetical protein